MPSEKSHGTTVGAGVGEGLARGAGAGREVEHQLARRGRDGVDDLRAPAAVLPEGEDVVGDVVALRDRVEHRADVGRLLVEIGAGHTERVGRSDCAAAVRVLAPAPYRVGDRVLFLGLETALAAPPRPADADGTIDSCGAARQPNPTFLRPEVRDWGVLTAPTGPASPMRARTSPEETDEGPQGAADPGGGHRPRGRRGLRRRPQRAPPRLAGGRAASHRPRHPGDPDPLAQLAQLAHALHGPLGALTPPRRRARPTGRRRSPWPSCWLRAHGARRSATSSSASTSWLGCRRPRRGVRRGDGGRGQGLPGRPRPVPHRPARPSYLGPDRRDDDHADPRPAVQRAPPRTGAGRSRATRATTSAPCRRGCGRSRGTSAT